MFHALSASQSPLWCSTTMQQTLATYSSSLSVMRYIISSCLLVPGHQIRQQTSVSMQSAALSALMLLKQISVAPGMLRSLQSMVHHLSHSTAREFHLLLTPECFIPVMGDIRQPASCRVTTWSYIVCRCLPGHSSVLHRHPSTWCVSRPPSTSRRSSRCSHTRT